MGRHTGFELSLRPALIDNPTIVRALVLVLDLVERLSGLAHVRPMAADKLVGQGEHQRDYGLLIPGFGSHYVAANALRLVRLIKEPIAFRFGECSRDRLLGDL